jgi:hypothetical protein
MSDEYQSIPVAVARAAVQESGELVALQGPLYLTTGTSPDEAVVEVWAPYFLPSDERPHPLLAKVVVTRKGQEPREVVISWAEYAAELELDDPAWLEKRRQKPMSIFGAEVERHAYRVVFADVLAAAMPPRIIAGVEPPQSWEPRNDRLMVVPDSGAVVRDWSAEVKAADAVTLSALYDEARDAGALVKVEGLQGAFTSRLLELEHPAPKPTPPTAPRPQGNRRRGKRPERK